VAHVLHACADDDVVDPEGNLPRTEVDRLLPRATLALDHRRGRLHRKSFLKPRGASDPVRLLADLLNATSDNVTDKPWIYTRSIEDGSVAAAKHVRGVGIAERSFLRVPPADRSPHRVDDYYLTS
jgi:hypothetical protein